MKPTIEILENINRNSMKNHGEVFTRLYRYMLRPDVYFLAYQNLYANNGASTKDTSNDTADGFSEHYVNGIIQKLNLETYEPSPRKTCLHQKIQWENASLGDSHIYG